MPTASVRSSDSPIPTHSRDTPPYLDSSSGFDLTELKVSKALKEVEGPILRIPADAQIINVKPEEISEFFAPPHYSEQEIQLRTEAAVEYGFNYLRRSDLKETAGLARSDFKRPLLVEAFEAVRTTVQKFRVASSDGKIIGAAPCNKSG